ncbi:MAG: hypothetical protein M1829_005391 [Trizodia sp. TS-e1964]|nr:MAG: hypothetical protein M1829_005391 [Trizodia sp. TS-e1964]
MGSLVISEVVSNTTPRFAYAGSGSMHGSGDSTMAHQLSAAGGGDAQFRTSASPAAAASASHGTHSIVSAPAPADRRATTTTSPPSSIDSPLNVQHHHQQASNSSAISSTARATNALHASLNARQPFPSQQHMTHPPYAAASTEASPHNSSNPAQPPRKPISTPFSSASTTVAAAAFSPSLRSNASVADRTSVASANCIKVRDLSHIQSFASEEFLTQPNAPPRNSYQDSSGGDVKRYEISGMPVADIIEMVAGLLTKITTTNDQQHEHIHRHIPPPEGTTSLTQQTSSVLAFHGKNVPSITILSYLSRIHKYCPTTYEVFLSLLVYFDRMTERVNAGPMQSLRRASEQGMCWGNNGRHSSSPSQDINTAAAAASWTAPRAAEAIPLAAARGGGGGGGGAASVTTPPPSGSLRGRDPIIVDPPSSLPADMSLDADAYNMSHFFVVDSFNIHRLVIAGVTCASKFFSDVFYTNSRYAKVGGLPLVELNHLELQFLLLNDFRLSVPVEELEAYGTMLVEFYAREVLSQRMNGLASEGGSSSEAGGGIQTPTPP